MIKIIMFIFLIFFIASANAENVSINNNSGTGFNNINISNYTIDDNNTLTNALLDSTGNSHTAKGIFDMIRGVIVTLFWISCMAIVLKLYFGRRHV